MNSANTSMGNSHSGNNTRSRGCAGIWRRLARQWRREPWVYVREVLRAEPDPWQDEVLHEVGDRIAAVAEPGELARGTHRDAARQLAPGADVVVIDPAKLDATLDDYAEAQVQQYGGLSRMVNRNDQAVVATGVNGAVVFRGGQFGGQFRDGYGQTVQSGRYLRAGARPGLRPRQQRSAAAVSA